MSTETPALWWEQHLEALALAAVSERRRLEVRALLVVAGAGLFWAFAGGFPAAFPVFTGFASLLSTVAAAALTAGLLLLLALGLGADLPALLSGSGFSGSGFSGSGFSGGAFPGNSFSGSGPSGSGSPFPGDLFPGNPEGDDLSRARKRLGGDLSWWLEETLPEPVRGARLSLLRHYLSASDAAVAAARGLGLAVRLLAAAAVFFAAAWLYAAFGLYLLLPLVLLLAWRVTRFDFL